MIFQQTLPVFDSDRALLGELSIDTLAKITGGNGAGNKPLDLSANLPEIEIQTTSDPEYRYLSIRRYG